MRPVSDQPAARAVVAAFDVDGTLTSRDCVVPFLRRVAGTGTVVVGLARVGHRVVPALARRDRDTLKALASRVAFRGRAAADIEAAGQAFAVEIERERLRPDVAARVAWHRAAGHDIVLVSASYGAYLRPLGAALGAAGVVSTELVVDRDGRCTGVLVGGNCRGAEKVRRLHAWLDERHGGREAVELWAYGDSAGDRELLADADRPVWAKGALPSLAETVDR
jgi:phosphatidylglycerophosphatase C